MKSRIIVICPEHGEFELQAANHVRVFTREDKKHLNPCGCPTCGKNHVRNRNVAGRKTTEQFTTEANEVHLDRYDYSNVEYKRNNINVEIICPEHGSFYQHPINHLRGTGCPRCKNSRGETKIAKVLSTKGIKYVKEHIFEDCVGDKGAPLKFDFYIPSKNLLIEYDGEQHFRPVKFHQNMTQKTMDNMFERTKKYDAIKSQFAETNQLKMVRIPYTKLKNIESILENLLG